jgi:hypothetical protein
MAEETKIQSLSELEDARVHITRDNKLRVEFRVNELIRKLVPGGSLASQCGGCQGCMGCGM